MALCARFVCFQKLSFQKVLALYSINTHFDTSTKDSFENIVGKEEIACNKQFPLFPQCFLLNQIIVSLFLYIFDVISSLASECEEPKIGKLGTILTTKVISW